ncbi:prepilin-type N-terminal cleavage/methylation domain-containing protein [Neptunomonas concharum]|uniref:Prepilin-type N-terminal cleavage/methylation domain-containing protein n=2 Tax=Neptunomonas concharum TaxID=1031538 RepID=A0A5P1R6Z8_9GAMM|nr:prepilin-type N-terminal cleavage/methylation domain-containing protein [Neptunomonas concharum]
MVIMAAKGRQQILATGKHQAGFTLLELMVIVTLIGLLSAAVIVNFSGEKEENPLTGSMATLKLQLRSLSDKAFIEQRWLGFLFTQHHYELMTFSSTQGWQKVPSFTPKTFPDALLVSLDSEGKPVRLAEESTIPQIQASPDGLLTPFKLSLSYLNETLELTDPYASAE